MTSIELYSTMFVYMLRHKATMGFAFTILILYAMLSITACMISLTKLEAFNVAPTTVHTHYFVLSKVNNGNCIHIKISYVRACFRSRCVLATMYTMSVDEVKFVGIKLRRLAKNVNVLEGGVSLGYVLAKLLKANVGNKIVVCTGSSCTRFRVVAVHAGELGASLIAFSSSPPSTHEYLCERSNSIHLFATEVLSNIRNLASVICVIISTLYIPAIAAALIKVRRELSAEFRCIYEIGVKISKINYSFTLSLLTLTAIYAFIGVCIGTILFHVSCWALRFLGMYIVFRPLPNIEVLSVPIAISLSSTAVLTYVISLAVSRHDMAR